MAKKYFEGGIFNAKQWGWVSELTSRHLLRAVYSLQKPGIGRIYRKQQIEVHKYPEIYPVASGEEKTSTDVVEE